MCLVACSSLARRGTNFSPLRPSTALATEGIYRWTRNPNDVGGTLAMIGIGLVFGLTWLAPLLVPSMLAMHFGVVRPEEQYLEDKFGDKARVPRYLAVVCAVDPLREEARRGKLLAAYRQPRQAPDGSKLVSGV
jgi:protein-S-isoprenylcysteine O-methyltransferase Ste14